MIKSISTLQKLNWIHPLLKIMFVVESDITQPSLDYLNILEIF